MRYMLQSDLNPADHPELFHDKRNKKKIINSFRCILSENSLQTDFSESLKPSFASFSFPQPLKEDAPTRSNTKQKTSDWTAPCSDSEAQLQQKNFKIKN